MNTFADIREDVGKIHRLCGETQAEWLFGLIRGPLPSGDVCEIGAFYGYITAVMAYACQGSDRHVLSVDHMLGGQCDFPEGSKCFYRDYADNLISRGLWDKVLPIAMKSWDAVALLDVMQPEIALLYLDGNHNTEPVFRELTILERFVPVGGVIAGDDCLPEAQENRPFTELWNRADKAQFMQTGAGMAVWRFFRGNARFDVLPNVPGNQFGFRKVTALA